MVASVDNQALAAVLSAITSTLAPAPGVPQDQVDLLRQELADVMRDQDISTAMAGIAPGLDTVSTQPGNVDETLIRAFEGLLSADAAPSTGGTPTGDLRVFRREMPVRTSQHPASVPPWAAGMEVDHTLGPFIDETGRRLWFDFFRRVRAITLARGTDQFVRVPIRGFLTGQEQYELAAGSVWLRSQLFTPTAPAGAFSGLRITGGTISFTGPVTVSGDTIVIGASDVCGLALDLDQPAPDVATGTTTGADAKDLDIQLPAHVTITCRPGSATVDVASDALQQLFGVTYRYTYDAASPVTFDAALNRIVVPFTTDAANVTSPIVRSDLIALEGEGAILASFWALPVTVTAIGDLGNAAGAGALVMRVGAGLHARWAGLDKGPIRLNACAILTEPGRIAITAPQSVGRAQQSFRMWDEENPDRVVRAVTRLTYTSAFLLLYNCLSSGAEAIAANDVTADADIDRPLAADGQRPAVHAPAANVILAEINAERYVYLWAVRIIQKLLLAPQSGELKATSFALRNAFTRTIGPDDFYLIGAWQAPDELRSGFLALVWPMSLFMPTLPDPYVTNYIPALRERRVAAAGGRLPVSLVSIVQWSDPATAVLRLLLVPEGPSSEGFLALSGVPSQSPEQAAAPTPMGQAKTLLHSLAAVRVNAIAETQQEDAANEAKLHGLFQDSLKVGPEQIVLLDVSTNADLFGVGIGIADRRRHQQSGAQLPFSVEGMDLVTNAFNTRIYTLPQIQWEPVQTVQNPDVQPYPFPSPVTSETTGDPTLIGTDAYKLVPIAPLQVVEAFLSEYNDAAASARLGALFSLPFGMKAAALLQRPHNVFQRGAIVRYNRPEFTTPQVTGGLQVSIIAGSSLFGLQSESPHFSGATIQTRNLIELLTGAIPVDADGKPLSVLGPVVDTIFNNEFKPAGNNPRVPLERLDISGYGASIFSDWLNPDAAIAATSQTKFDVVIGRTSHEIVQVKSILYPWAVPVVRTITIQRTSGGGVTRYDSGWHAQGAGVYDFSYKDAMDVAHPNPYEIHPGVIGGVFNVTGIRDTGRTYRQPAANPDDDVIMQEVFFDGDVRIESVLTGGANDLVPSRKQRGFVQLSPYQKPLTPQQFYDLLAAEGALGGPVDCVVNVGESGQHMRVVLADVAGVSDAGGIVLVSTAHGLLSLPKEGAWSLAKRRTAGTEIVSLDEDGALPLIREAKLAVTPTQPYRFADPADIKRASTPDTDYGLLHSTGSQKVIFLRPTIASGDPHIRSAIDPLFADSYAILGSKGIFPAVDQTFPLGGGGGVLDVLGDARLRLSSPGTFTAPPGLTRDLLRTGTSRIYVDYSDTNSGGATSDVHYAFDSTAPVPWTAAVRNHSIVIDLMGLTGLIVVTSDLAAEFGAKPNLSAPVMKFGPVLQPIVDLLSFFGNFDMAQAFRVDLGNATTDSWQPKWKASLLGMKLEFPLLRIRAFGVHVGGATEAAQEAFEAATPLPPLKLEIELEIEGHYNMLPFSFTSSDPTADISKAGHDMLSVGASLKFGGELHILCVALSPTLGLYFYGMLELEFGVDSKEGESFEFKVAVGLELATKWPIVGDVSISMAVGLDMEFKSTGHGMFALMVFKGEAELLDGVIVIGIHIEAKGGDETETEDGVDNTYAVCEVEFAAEVTLAFVIHFEFDVTWQEKKQLS
ncbi:MAG TPA: hypothetical protein DEV93_15880 [Chloroflexi bacterium]|nr:hypothetical protein [Chloroflexota bacterium]